MNVDDAQPYDIYADATGKLWRCVGICREPTVIFEEVEGRTPEPPSPYTNQAIGMTFHQAPQRAPIIKERKSGGVYGYMWHGWKRIFRHGETT